MLKSDQQAKRNTINALRDDGLMDFVSLVASYTGALDSISVEHRDQSGNWTLYAGYEQEFHTERYVNLNRVSIVETRKEVWIAEMPDGGLWWLKDNEVDGRYIKHQIIKPFNKQATTKITPETGF